MHFITMLGNAYFDPALYVTSADQEQLTFESYDRYVARTSIKNVRKCLH